MNSLIISLLPTFDYIMRVRREISLKFFIINCLAGLVLAAVVALLNKAEADE